VKQIGLILILLSSVLTVITLLIDELYNYIDTLIVFYPAVSIYIKYHILTLCVGLVIYGYYINQKKEKIFVWLSACFMFFSFLYQELGSDQLFNLTDLMLRIVYTIFLSIYIWIAFSNHHEIPYYARKIHIILITIFLLYYIYALITFKGTLPYLQNVGNRVLYMTCYLLFHYAIYDYFKRVYKMFFTHTYEVNLKD
jgi:hypothetical protein